MSSYSTFVNVANLPKDLQDRVKVALSDETRDDLSEQTLNGLILNDLLCTLIKKTEITNRYLSEMLGDKINEDEL